MVLVGLASLFALGGALLVIAAWVFAPNPIGNRNGIIGLVIALLLFILATWILSRQQKKSEEKEEEKKPAATTTTTADERVPAPPLPKPTTGRGPPNPGPIKSMKLPHYSRRDTAIGAGIVIFIIVIIIAVVGWAIYSETRSFFDRGCEPATWNQWGQPVWWRCPP